MGCKFMPGYPIPSVISMSVSHSRENRRTMRVTYLALEKTNSANAVRNCKGLMISDSPRKTNCLSVIVVVFLPNGNKKSSHIKASVLQRLYLLGTTVTSFFVLF